MESEKTNAPATGAQMPDLPPDGHPLRQLGKRLADLLQCDDWNNCEALIKRAWEMERHQIDESAINYRFSIQWRDRAEAAEKAVSSLDASNNHLCDRLTAAKAEVKRLGEREGWVRVPVEPTEAMIEAGYRAVGALHYSPTAEQGWGTHASHIYRAMLQAAERAESLAEGKG